MAQTQIPFKAEHDELVSLAESAKTANKNAKSNPFVEFIIGCILIPFALVLLWKNEKKLVTYSKCIGEAQKVFKRIDLDHPYDENDLVLVSGSGKTTNSQDICDDEFGITVQDSYRLVRTVEMLQWVRIKHTERHDGHERVTYSYEKQWREKHEDDTNHESRYKNPGEKWPFHSSVTHAQNIKLGGFSLQQSQILRLGV